MIGCTCPTCTSDDIRDKRLRCSLHLQSETTSIIIDTGPDFRYQMLKYGITDIDAVLYTHLHYDHIAGFDDIRPFNFNHGKKLAIYAHDETEAALRRIFPYAFGELLQVGGGIPQVDVISFDREELTIGDISLQPLDLYHGKLKVKGFRMGDFAYCTDTNFITEESYEKLSGVKNLIIDGLRPQKHPTHFNIEEALEAIARISPEKAYLTHIAHQIKHSDIEKTLPENVYIAFDGLSLKAIQ